MSRYAYYENIFSFKPSIPFYVFFLHIDKHIGCCRISICWKHFLCIYVWTLMCGVRPKPAPRVSDSSLQLRVTAKDLPAEAKI
jgi:hypothetical protein